MIGKNEFFFQISWRTSVHFVGPLTPLFQILVMSALGFKARVYSLACVLCCLGARETSDSPLVQHQLTSW